MLAAKPQSFVITSVTASLIIALLASCGVVPKDYPRNKPFVYKTNINLEGNFSKEEKASLEAQLKNQLDDSMRTRTVYKLFYKGFNRSVLQKPPVYDSTNADRSVTFMKALLTSQGYFRDSIWYDTTMVVKTDADPPQYRTTVNFTVVPGKQFTIDSVSHVINNKELQALTDATKDKTVLVKGRPFSKQIVAAERDRLTEIYRDNGYLLFSSDELVGVWDTLNLALLRPTVDPFEQIQMLEELNRRKDTPTADIEMRLRPGYNVERIKKYFVGRTSIYPDYNYADTAGMSPVILAYDSSYTFITYRNLFRKKFITQNIYFHHGDLYNQKRFTKTITRFNSLGAWRLVNIEPIIRNGTDTVDFAMYLTPNLKLSFTTNIEGSFNNSNSLVTQENLFGIGANMQLMNRNFGRSSNRATTAARYSTELDTKGQFVKTIQASISHSIDFPKPIPNAKWIPERFKDNLSTSFRFSVGNIDRKDLYNLTSVTSAWGYNLGWKNKTFSLKLPNIEYAHLSKRDSLIKFLNENPSLRDVFPQNGLVLSVQGGFAVRWGKGNVSQIFKTNIEESGLLTSLLNLNVLDSLFKFVKLDAEYIRRTTLGKNELVFRSYVGAGFAMKTKERQINPQLPFFKQFSAGGPYSMRAWGLRTLGPGSSLRDTIPFRFGDFQFETNVEYRFPLFKLGGYRVSSCFFTDIGNVWFLKKNPDFPEGTLTANTFLKDMAVGIGTGLRFDFEFFKLRLDYGLKAKNPSPLPSNAAGQNKWFYKFDPFGGIIQLGINYPFAF